MIVLVEPFGDLWKCCARDRTHRGGYQMTCIHRNSALKGVTERKSVATSDWKQQRVVHMWKFRMDIQIETIGKWKRTAKNEIGKSVLKDFQAVARLKKKKRKDICTDFDSYYPILLQNLHSYWTILINYQRSILMLFILSYLLIVSN